MVRKRKRRVKPTAAERILAAIQELGPAASSREIAERARCHRRTARIHLAILRERGLIPPPPDNAEPELSPATERVLAAWRALGPDASFGGVAAKAGIAEKTAREYSKDLRRLGLVEFQSAPPPPNSRERVRVALEQLGAGADIAAIADRAGCARSTALTHVNAILGREPARGPRPELPQLPGDDGPALETLTEEKYRELIKTRIDAASAHKAKISDYTPGQVPVQLRPVRLWGVGR